MRCAEIILLLVTAAHVQGPVVGVVMPPIDATQFNGRAVRMVPADTGGWGPR